MSITEDRLVLILWTNRDDGDAGRAEEEALFGLWPVIPCIVILDGLAGVVSEALRPRFADFPLHSSSWLLMWVLMCSKLLLLRLLLMLLFALLMLLMLPALLMLLELLELLMLGLLPLLLLLELRELFFVLNGFLKSLVSASLGVDFSGGRKDCSLEDDVGPEKACAWAGMGYPCCCADDAGAA